MDAKLNIKGLFESYEELSAMVQMRKICYDTEPYYISTKKSGLLQIGFQLNLYATFPEKVEDTSPDSPVYAEVERDVMKLAEALSNTCNPVHMCESTIIDPSTITYSKERKMRPDVTVHVPIFDQQNFGHPVDDHIKETLHAAVGLIETAGVKKLRWQD